MQASNQGNSEGSGDLLNYGDVWFQIRQLPPSAKQLLLNYGDVCFQIKQLPPSAKQGAKAKTKRGSRKSAQQKTVVLKYGPLGFSRVS